MKPLLREVAPKVGGDRSQFGEGSIISEILRRIGVGGGVCVEFGAGDGLHLSNTAHLWEHGGWYPYLIEADINLYLKLFDNLGDAGTLARGQTDHHFVTPGNVNEYVPLEANVVSIDVDGDDYAILDAMEARPYVLCVEHHPMIPAHISMVGGPDIGCSALALKEWADHNGFMVVAMTHCNTIMVDRHDGYLFDDVDTDFLHMFDPSGITWVLSNVKTGDFDIHGPWPFGRPPALT